MLNLDIKNNGLIMKHVKLDYDSTTKCMHVTFDIRSSANCYRETDNKNTWIMNVWTAKAEGVKICPFANVDWQKLQENIEQRSNLKEEQVRELMFFLKRLKT